MFAIDERLEALWKRWLAVKPTDVAEIHACKCKKLVLLSECEILKKKCKRLENLWLRGEMKNSALKDEFAENFRYIEGMISRINGIPL